MSNLEYACRECSFEIYIPIGAFESTVVGLYDDRRFPGRCIVVLRDHYEHLDQVPERLALEMQRLCTAVGRTLRSAGLATRVNYAVLGNEHPHVHTHVIPRGGPNDLVPKRPPWQHPHPVTKLAHAERTALLDLLKRSLHQFEAG